MDAQKRPRGRPPGRKDYGKIVSGRVTTAEHEALSRLAELQNTTISKITSALLSQHAQVFIAGEKKITRS